MRRIRAHLPYFAVAAALLAAVAVVALARYYAAGMHPIYFESSPQAMAALAHYLARDYAGAARELRAHLARHPEDDAQDEAAYEALLLGRLDDAASAARGVLRADPGAPQATLTLAQVLLERGLAREALELLRSLIAAAPADPVDALALAAIIESRLGEYDAAIATWERALRYREPGRRLSIYVSTLDTVAALLARAPRPGRETLLAECFRYLQRFDRGARSAVRRHARAAIAAGDHAGAAWIALGDMEWRSKRAEAARQAFEQAAASDPESAYPHYYLAFVHSDRGDLAAELRHATLAYERAPDAEAAQWLLHLLAEKFGDYRQVVTIANQRLSEGRREYTVLLELGQAYGALGDYGAAIATYGRALELRPSDYFVLANLAFWHVKAGRRAEAIELARRAAALRRDWSYPLLLVGRALAEDFRYEEAIPVFEAAFRIEQPRTEDLAQLCTVYHGASRWQEGLRCFETVLRSDPTNVRARRMIAEARNNAALAAKRAAGAQP